ncbi:non-hydrolyzing UDP-N-acetylglucosamine 2-epimerase [Halobacteriovorax sp. ZH5_bin.2]|uniref:non-hydrolyzing UDP-N-acetylglucosamine 2-epimerase n=1 Tax=Halobacteriovorax sp. ZH5_bin.2 TaxID=3157727 RepID=UPI00371F061B
MSKSRVLTIIGTRPELIKMSPLIPLLDESFEHIFVHSGQHYSENMDKIFFDELDIRKPDYNLKVNEKNPVNQVCYIAEKLEEILVDRNIQGVIVHGDTNTTLAGAIAAKKSSLSDVKLFHVEAGCRSFNKKQTEELNRILVDSVSDLLFASNKRDENNLLGEGHDQDTILVTRNTVIDSCTRASSLVNTDELLSKFKLTSKNFVLLTMHRQETVDNKEKLSSIVKTIDEIAEKHTIIFPIHPRTKLNLERFDISFKSKNIKIIEPQSYLSLIGLIKEAKFILTDSGGMQEEAAVIATPAIVLRNETEYLNYVEQGKLFLTGVDKYKIFNSIDRIKNNESCSEELVISDKPSELICNAILRKLNEK